MKKKPRVIAVVVTYNRLPLLKRVVSSLNQQSYRPSTIVVVDNASTDGTEEWAREEAERGQLTYLRLPTNTGGAGGFHFGMQYAYSKSCDFVWLLDDDAVPEERCLETLLKSAALTGGLCLFPKVLFPDGRVDVRSIPRRNFYPGKIYMKKEIPPLHGAPTLVSIGTFVGALIRREAMEMVGFPIKEFFLWFDDIEYTYRISRRGPVYFVPEAIVYHHTRAGKPDKIKLYYMMRNWSYLACRKGKAPAFIAPVLLAAGIIKWKAFRRDMVFSAIKGIIDGTRGELQ